jgi:hypothetical protein
MATGADAELHLRDGRAWVIVVGTVDAARASAVAELVDALVRGPTFRRVSVDLTCTVLSDRGAAVAIGALHDGAPPWVDVTTAGAIAWRRAV